jgi:hypothetical protein
VQAQRLDIGGVFTRIFETYRDQAALFLPAAFIVFIPVAILAGLARASFVFGIIAAILNVIATYAYQGMVVEAVRDIQDSVRDFELGGLFRSVAPVILPLIVASVLAGLGIAVGLILVIVPGLILLTWWAVLAPSIVLERRGVIEAFGRSRELVRGNAWQVFAVIVIVFIIQLVLSAILSAIIAIFAANAVGSGVANLLTNTLVAPISAIAAAVMFLELRLLRGEAALPAGAADAGAATAPGGFGGTGGGVPREAPGTPPARPGGGMAEPGAEPRPPRPGGPASPGGRQPPAEPGGPPPAAGPQSPR